MSEGYPGPGEPSHSEPPASHPEVPHPESVTPPPEQPLLPVTLPALPFQSAPPPRDPLWGYEDLALFAGALLPSFTLAVLLLRITKSLAPRILSSGTANTLVFQVFAYIFMLGSLYLVVAWRYREPFWRSLGWSFPIPRAFALIAEGPLLAIVVLTLGVALGLPEEPSAIEDMITSRDAFAFMVLFGVILAPAFEEMIFRGFLYPLFARNLGPWGAIALTAIPFGLLHGAQNHCRRPLRMGALQNRFHGVIVPAPRLL
jgi:uncharacterized protein